MVKLSMNEIERTAAAADEPVDSEGGRSPSTLSTGQRATSQGGTPPAATRPGPLAPGQRWSAGRKREVVLRLLRGEAAELLSRELAVPIYKLEQWRAKAEAALDGALKEREGEPVNVELAAAMQRIGELSMENELLRSRIERPGPLARRRSR
jgi:transposase